MRLLEPQAGTQGGVGVVPREGPHPGPERVVEVLRLRQGDRDRVGGAGQPLPPSGEAGAGGGEGDLRRLFAHPVTDARVRRLPQEPLDERLGAARRALSDAAVAEVAAGDRGGERGDSDRVGGIVEHRDPPGPGAPAVDLHPGGVPLPREEREDEVARPGPLLDVRPRLAPLGHRDRAAPERGDGGLVVDRQHLDDPRGDPAEPLAPGRDGRGRDRRERSVGHDRERHHHLRCRQRTGGGDPGAEGRARETLGEVLEAHLARVGVIARGGGDLLRPEPIDGSFPPEGEVAGGPLAGPVPPPAVQPEGAPGGQGADGRFPGGGESAGALPRARSAMEGARSPELPIDAPRPRRPSGTAVGVRRPGICTFPGGRPALWTRPGALPPPVGGPGGAPSAALSGAFPAPNNAPGTSPPTLGPGRKSSATVPFGENPAGRDQGDLPAATSSTPSAMPRLRSLPSNSFTAERSERASGVSRSTASTAAERANAPRR